VIGPPYIQYFIAYQVSLLLLPCLNRVPRLFASDPHRHIFCSG
jgi:hypothetical protein